MPVDPEDFRRVLGSWASGVTIVTAHDGERQLGMTVSAFSSVSLEPPLVLVCADKGANTLALIEAAGAFTVNLLAQGQQELSELFADKAREFQRFDGLDCEVGATGCARISGALGYLDCRVVQAVDAGDHVVYIGRVEGAELSDGEPLVYCRGKYGRLK